MPEKGQSLYFDYKFFPFVRPPEMEGRAQRHKAVIVGGGPVGLACAIELALHGVPSVVLEDDDTFATGSRAACISRRSMEILQQLGVTEPFLAKALPWTSGSSFFRSQEIFRLQMPHSPDQRYYPMANLQQNYLEEILYEKAIGTGLVEVRWRERLAAIAERDDHVALQVDTPEGAYDTEAAYVIAADGARSEVRRLMNLRMSGESFEGKYLIADIQMHSDYPTERRAWFDPPVNRDSTVLMHRQPDDIWRVDYQLRERDDPEEELKEPRIRRRIQEVLDMAGETASWELDWFSLYKAHCLCLDEYNVGRVMFAGDAAHLVPIFGVRGLNSGFADANNLCWKLAYVIQGLARPELLATYTQERRNATLDIFRNARKSTIFMTPPSRGYRLMRQAALSLALSEHWAAVLANPRQSAPYDYTDSVLNSFSLEEGAFSAGPPVGAPPKCLRLDYPKDEASRFLTDRFGLESTLMLFSDGPRLPSDLYASIDQLRLAGIPLRVLVITTSANFEADATQVEVIDDPQRRVFDAYDAKHRTGYLFRPDWHVAARKKDFSGSDLKSAIGRLCDRHGEA